MNAGRISRKVRCNLINGGNVVGITEDLPAKLIYAIFLTAVYLVGIFTAEVFIG